jgi:hypothetical protein
MRPSRTSRNQLIAAVSSKSTNRTTSSEKNSAVNLHRPSSRDFTRAAGLRRRGGATRYRTLKLPRGGPFCLQAIANYLPTWATTHVNCSRQPARIQTGPCWSLKPWVVRVSKPTKLILPNAATSGRKDDGEPPFKSSPNWGLLDQRDSSGEVFEITNEGFRVVDLIAPA